MNIGQGDSKVNPTIKLNNIQLNNTPFESPKRVSAFKTVEFKSTAMTKSPLSKIFQEYGALFQPSLFKTPRHGLFEQMVYLRTPDNRFTTVQGRLAEKLDFDDLGGSAKKQQQIIEGDQQISQYDCSYENVDQYEQGSQQQVQIKKIQIPANIPWQITQPVLLNKGANLVYNQNFVTETQSNKICCNCKKSRCLKLYCECFRNNQVCSGCNCVACLNTDEHNPERYKAFVAMIEANPQAFCPKIESQKHTKGCHCKKSNCQKKYCECYQAGLPCSELCRCQDCKNTDGSHCNHKSTPSKMKVKPKMIES